MSSEFSCDYCSNNPRHPCYSRKEASTCGNACPGQYFNFKSSEVAAWIRYNSNQPELLEAADLIESTL